MNLVTSAPSCSVIIPVYNGAKTLPFQLTALANQTYTGTFEIIVVDNRSTDGSTSLALSYVEHLPSLRVVQAYDRQGSNYARNIGMEASKGDLLLFCDADDIADKDWIAAMVASSHEGGVLGGRLEEDSLNRHSVRHWRPSQPIMRLPVALDYLPYAVSANLAIHRSVWLHIGGWNEAYSGGGDDVELSWRAQLAGYEVRFVPDALVHYRHRGDMPSLAKQSFNYGAADVRLYRDYRTNGIARSKASPVLKEWIWLLLTLVDFRLLTRVDRRGIWTRKAAYRFGRLIGCARFRTWYP